MDLAKLVAELSSLNVMEAVKLSKRLEEMWGVSAAAPVQTPSETAPTVVEPEEQTEFAVILTGVDPAKKISVIKEVRAITSLGLKEAKELVETAPKTLRESASKADAMKLKAQVEEAGGTIVLQ